MSVVSVECSSTPPIHWGQNLPKFSILFSQRDSFGLQLCLQMFAAEWYNFFFKTEQIFKEKFVQCKSKLSGSPSHLLDSGHLCMSVGRTRLIGNYLGTRVASFGCKEGSGPPAHGEINGFASSLSMKVPFKSHNLLLDHLYPLCFDSHYYIHDKITGVITIFSE